MKFRNGARVRFAVDAFEDKIQDIALIPHVVLRGPDPDKVRIPPYFEKTAHDSTDNYVECIQIYDPDYTESPESSEYGLRQVSWPGFNISEGRKVILAILEKLGIRTSLRFRQEQPGLWRLHRNGRAPVRIGAKQGIQGMLRGSKYKWEEMVEGEPCIIRARSSAALQNNFNSWAGRRDINWRIRTRSLGPGLVQVTRYSPNGKVAVKI